MERKCKKRYDNGKVLDFELSLDDEELEVFLVWNCFEPLIEIILGLDRCSKSERPLVTCNVVTWVQATDSVVLIISHHLHVVVFLKEVCAVKDESSVEDSIILPLISKVWGHLVEVQELVLSVSQAANNILSSQLKDWGHVLLAIHGVLHLLWSPVSELSLVLEEHADTSLLIPEHQVLALIPGCLNMLNKLTQSGGLPSLSSSAYHYFFAKLLFQSWISRS